MTVANALRAGEQQLKLISDAPALDSERLLLFTLKETESTWLYSHPEQVLTSDQVSAWEVAVTKRATGLPLAYILGTAEFYGRMFIVTPAVLIPRPATEALIDAALSALQKLPQPATIADIGTGSGCIAIMLLLEAKLRDMSLTMLATDISEAALEVATKNARRHGVADQINFRCGDLLAPLVDTKVDLIVSNPPYVPTSELIKANDYINTRGLTFEPRLALDGGLDGLEYVRKITATGIPAIIETIGGKIIRSNV